MTFSGAVKALAGYAVKNGIIPAGDIIWAENRLLEVLCTDDFDEDAQPCGEDLSALLDYFCGYAYEKGLIEGDSVTYRDLFDTKLMGALTPPPSVVIERFRSDLAESPEKATDRYYSFSKATNYIRTDRIKKDLRWVTPTVFGDLDITVNLSKPEKDPKAIAAALKNGTASKYPKCLLCRENEGFAGSLSHPARQNHRVIPMTLAGSSFYMQYSPYVYYNEHCIVFNERHTPMKIDRAAFDRLLDFVTVLPHYFIGSNADLPIVGGSILTHDHFQGGRYEFAMFRAPDEFGFAIPGHSGVRASVLKWPLSVIRLRGADRDEIAGIADMILGLWRDYTDESAFIFAETDGERHNTVTPIARRAGADYQLDIVLRNNITTPEHPLGVYHPHAELHHIKKENIGLIEVMGLAVLPSRLKTELAKTAAVLCAGGDLHADEATAKHADWADKIAADHGPFTDIAECESVLRNEVGKVFCRVLCDAGVYKCTPDGREAFRRFLSRFAAL